MDRNYARTLPHKSGPWGADRLAGQRALITGADSGTGRAVAIAFAREGANVALSYLEGEEEKDAHDTADLVRAAGRSCVLLPGDIREEDVCKEIVDKTFSEFGGIDTLVLNAGTQHKRDTEADISRDSIMDVFATNLLASSVVSGGEAGVMIVGQSLEEVRATTRYLIGIFTLAAIAGVGIASVLGALLVRNTLAPLQSLRATAARVSDTPLASGYIQFPERPGADGTGAGSEVQDLASSFNQMLDHVEAALVEREASETKLRQFAADASHELRTPLASISGYAQLASREGDSLSETVGTSLERIQSESRRMGTIVEDLLLLARLDAGREESGAEALVAPVVLECLSNAQAAGPDKIWGADIAPNAAELKARISPAALHHSVSNLLANARRHTPAGTRVTVAVQCLDDDVVSITVEDSGPGIAPDLASRVFDRFVTGEAARSPTGDGNNEGHPVRNSGLGLAIAHELVRQASGTLTVDSIPGRTVFEIRLKRAQFSPEQ